MPVQQFDKVVLTGNPNSGWGKARRWFDRVAQALRDAGCEVAADMSRRPAEVVAAHAQDAGAVLIVGFGGDGTFNEMLNEADLERVTLGLIPAGTGNVLAQEVGMSKTPMRAVEQIIGGRVVRLDVGVCNGRRFCCMVGAGIDGWVIRSIHERRTGRLTQFHYLPHIARLAARPQHWQIAVELDGREIGTDLDQVVVGSAHSYGGPIEATPAAGATSGALDVLGVRRSGLLELAGLSPLWFLKAAHRSRSVLYARGSRVRVESPLDDVPYQLDGEPAGTLPAEISIEPGALPMLVPAAYRPAPSPIVRRDGGP